MMSRVLLSITASAFLAPLALLGGSAWADDVFPAPWRGDAGSFVTTFDTWQESLPGTYLPDSYEYWPVEANLGVPLAYIEFGVGTVLAGYEGRTNVLTFDQDQGGEDTPMLGFLLDNFDEDKPLKRIRVQVTYQHVIGCIPYWIEAEWFWPGDSDHTSMPAFEVWVDELDWGDGWRTRVYEFELDPNPWDELVLIEFWQYGGPQTATFVDQVVIDTLCFDLPGDVDGNGVVDGLDLTAVMTAWETRPGDPLWDPDADLDGNDLVDGLDLTEVISNWTVTSAAAASDTDAKPGRGKGNVKAKKK